jgi:hypothetical protein
MRNATELSPLLPLFSITTLPRKAIYDADLAHCGASDIKALQSVPRIDTPDMSIDADKNNSRMEPKPSPQHTWVLWL